MTDRMMSRRCLIERLPARCCFRAVHLRTNPRPKKVKKQGKIKKAEPPTSPSTYAIRTSCTRSTTTRAL